VFQEKYLEQVLPLLLQKVDQDPNQPVQQCAANALGILSADLFEEPDPLFEEFLFPIASMLRSHFKDNRFVSRFDLLLY
jgi:hypothetical protein